jgi:hypothetical protein
MNLIYTEKFALVEPLKLADGRTLTEINLRRPKVRDLKQVQAAHREPAEQVALIAVTSEEKVVPEDLDDMDLEDYMKISTFFQRIMGAQERAAGNGGATRPLVPVSAQ